MNKIVIALIGIVPACLTSIFGYMEGKTRTDANIAYSELKGAINYKNSDNPSFKKLIYPNYGIYLLAPISWTIEDSPARLAGGEFNLIQRYEDTKGAIGMNFRLRPVQQNYINDIQSQISNQKEVFEKNSGATTVENITVSGQVGQVFTYEAATGQRRMRVKLYWLRLVPTVQLQIQCVQYTDATDSIEFWKNVDGIISSIVIASDSWQARYREWLKNDGSS